jgi:hypothetical protein
VPVGRARRGLPERSGASLRALLREAMTRPAPDHARDVLRHPDEAGEYLGSARENSNVAPGRLIRHIRHRDVNA